MLVWLNVKTYNKPIILCEYFTLVYIININFNLNIKNNFVIMERLLYYYHHPKKPFLLFKLNNY